MDVRRPLMTTDDMSWQVIMRLGQTVSAFTRKANPESVWHLKHLLQGSYLFLMKLDVYSYIHTIMYIFDVYKR